MKTSTTLDAIKEQLEKERVGIQATAEKLNADLASVNADLARINAAIAALNGQEPASGSGKPSPPKQRKKQLSPSASKADVVTHIRAVLEQEGTLDQEALCKRVEEEIVKAGFTRMGYSLRFKEALATPEFVTSQGGIQLRSDKRVPAKG